MLDAGHSHIDLEAHVEATFGDLFGKRPTARIMLVDGRFLRPLRPPKGRVVCPIDRMDE